MATEKVYSIKIELGQAQQQLDTATKSLAELKATAAAANTEAKEAQAVYRDNAAALQELVAEQKQLATAQKSAPAGEGWAQATAALDRNKAAQQQLNKIVAESKIDYQDAKQAAAEAGAAVGQQSGKVRELAAGVKEYQAAAKAAAKEFAPDTFGALRGEITQLRAELDGLTKGSPEAAAAIQQIASKESELRKLDLAFKSDSPRQQARAFGVLTQALGGVVGVAISGAQALGLSDANAQKYTQRMQALTGVLYSVESVNRLLNGENLSLIKSIGGTAKAWFTASEGVTVFGRTTRAAIASTGIGVLVLAVGALVSWFLDLNSTVKSSESTFTQYKATVIGGFEALLEAGKDWFKFWIQLFTLDWSGAAETARTAGKGVAQAYADGRAGVIDEARRAEYAAEADKLDRLLKINQAAGVETENLERDVLRRRVAAQKKGTKEEQDALAELAAFNKAAKKRHHEEVEAETLAHLNRLLGMEQAAGKESYQIQRKIEQEKLDFLLNAPKRDQAAIEAQRGVIAAQQLAHEREVNEKRFAARQAALDGIIALEEAKGKDAFKKQLQRETDYLIHLQNAGTRDEEAIRNQLNKIALLTENHDQQVEQRRRQRQILANQNEIAILDKQGKDTLDLRLQNAELLLSLDKDETPKQQAQRDADLQALLVLQEEYNAKMKAIKLAEQQQGAELEEQGKEAQRALVQGGLDYTTQVYTESLAKKRPNLGLKLIKSLFGIDSTVSEEAKKQAEDLQSALNDSFSSLYQGGQQLASAFLDAAVQQTQQALEAAQQQLQTASQQLDDAKSKADATAQALESAQGAKRSYLIEKLAKERAETERLAAAKAKAAREEKAQQEAAHKLQKIGLELSAATTLATNVAAAAKAVDAGVSAVAGAAALPFPANIPAIIAAVAAVAAAVASAKQLATATKYEAGTGALGSDGVLQGPTHAGGGIQLYSPSGVHWGEAEGGEAITPRDASSRNAAVLAMLRTEGRGRTLSPADYMRALAGQAQGMAQNMRPTPESYYRAGGVLNKGTAAPAGGYASAEEVRGLRTEQQRTNTLLGQLVGNTEATASNTARTAAHTSKTADNTDEIKRKPTGGPPRTLEDVQREAEQLRQHTNFVQGLTL